MTGKQFVIAETTRQSKGKQFDFLDVTKKYLDFSKGTKQKQRKEVDVDVLISLFDNEHMQEKANRIGLNQLELFEVSIVSYPKQKNQKRLLSGAKIIFKSSVIKW